MNSGKAALSEVDPRRTQEIVLGIREGDLELFGELYQRVSGALYAWLRFAVRPEMKGVVDPEDVLQEVWLRGIERFANFDPERGGFRAWIFGVAKNILLEALRETREPAVQASLGGVRVTHLREPSSEATLILSSLVRDEAVQAMVQTLDRLSRQDRRLVLYCGLEGMSHKEVAPLLGLEVEAVTKRWQRLRQRLAEQHPGWAYWAES